MKANETVLVTLEGELTVRQECARCLSPYDAVIAVHLQEEFHPSIDIATGRLIPDTGDDDALVIDLQHVLDLTEVVRQSIILALPTTPLCREDCAGLCPICGANRNIETCNCVDAEIDPRWAALDILLHVEEDAA